MIKWIQSDERSELIIGRVSLIFLGLTQAGLLSLIFIQRYLMNSPAAYYNDLVIILSFSIIGSWLTNLYLGGLQPVMQWKVGLSIYTGAVLCIGIPYLIIRGLPAAGDWARFITIILGGPGLIIGIYTLAAYLGIKRIERITGGTDEQ